MTIIRPHITKFIGFIEKHCNKVYHIVKIWNTEGDL